jgi:hypothetical protein
MPSSASGPQTEPWPGDDALGAELSHVLACGGVAGEGTLDDERRAAVERDVANEHEPALGYPHHHVIRGVRGPDGLSDAPVGEQFRLCDEAGLVAREENGGFADLTRITEPAQGANGSRICAIAPRHQASTAPARGLPASLSNGSSPR